METLVCSMCGGDDYVICYAPVFQFDYPVLCILCNNCGSITYSMLLEAMLKEVKT